MPRQVEDSEYQRLMSRAAVADFVESIYDDPATGKDARRLIKRKYPNLQIPDLDIEDRLDAKLAARDKQRDDEERQRKRKDEEDGWAADRERVRKQYGFTDDGMKDLEKFMVDKNVGSYEVAAHYHAAKNPKPSDPTAAYNDSHWNHGRSEEWKEIAADPEAYARKEIMGALHRDAAKQRGAF